MYTPNLSFERDLWSRGRRRVAGVDEVGRGCLSGPVVAAAVVFAPECEIPSGVQDSKKLSAAQRETLFAEIIHAAEGYAVGAVSAPQIDRVNIHYASYLAMRRALCRVDFDHALIDGRDSKAVELGPHTALIKGDQRSVSIACASIIAKVLRDRLMRRMAERWPGYAWENNAGYGTKAHLQALQELGVTPLHRRSFRPVREALEVPGNR